MAGLFGRSGAAALGFFGQSLFGQSLFGQGPFALGLCALLLANACAGAAKEPEAAPTKAPEPAPAVPAQDPAEPSAAPTKQKLAEAVAAQVAATWNAEKAAKEKVELTLKIKVEDMSALVVGKGDGAYTLTGKDAVNTKPDVGIDLSREDADALAEGGSSLKALKDAGKVKTDNEQGLDFFLTYTK